MSEPVLVRVHTLDPISESGILAQLRKCPDIRVADTLCAGTAGKGTWPQASARRARDSGNHDAGRSSRPSVALAVADSIDDDATRWLRALHRCDSLPVVLVVGQLNPGTLMTVVESGVRAVVRRCEATPERWARSFTALRPTVANCHPTFWGSSSTRLVTSIAACSSLADSA